MAKASLSRIALLLLGLPFLALAWIDLPIRSLRSTSLAPVMKGFNIQKLSGKWYPVLTISPDPTPKATRACIIEPQSNGNAFMMVEIPVNGACKLRKVLLSKNRFWNSIFSTLEGKAFIIDTDYETYFFAYFTKADGFLLQLYAKSKTVSEEVRQKFLDIVNRSGLPTQHYQALREEDLCTSPPANG
nr:epididymal secretory protein 4-like [Anolis sagrei ordinatus]